MLKFDNNQTLKHGKITGVGSVLIDLLINESDHFLEKLDKEKGGMTLVDDSYISSILKQTCQKPVVVPGGAACNTIVGIGKLGGNARFIGKIGDDEYGHFYEKQLRSINIEPVFETSKTSTGKVLSIITPDAQRSMFTYLGASTELEADKINSDMFKNTSIAVIEGYLLFNHNLMMACLKGAKKAGALVALDLASFEVVNASKDTLKNIVKDYVDILIANEDEAKAYTGFSDEIKAVETLSENVSIAVLKLGEKGSYIFYQGQLTKIPAQKGDQIKDTTGAGDLWAAGFLFGISNNWSIEKSGDIGSACGYEVCKVIGAQIPDHKWKEIKNIFL